MEGGWGSVCEGSKLVSMEDKHQRSRKKLLTSRPSLAATYGSSVRGGGGMEGRREEMGWGGGGGRNHSGYSIIMYDCLLSLHTPHLYDCVTVDLNSFVVQLWKQTLYYSH